MLKRTALVIAFSTLFAGFGNNAQATPIKIDATYKNMTLGGESFKFMVNGKTSQVNAGMMTFDIKNISGSVPLSLSKSFSSFCIEFNQYVRKGQHVAYTLSSINSFFSKEKADGMTRLYTGFNKQVTSAKSSAAFQLALWELVEDFDGTNWNNLDLTKGKFSVTTKKDTVDLAQTWLNQLSQIKSKHNMYVLTNKDAQDQLIFDGTPNSVSAPTTIGVFGLGLLALGLRRRPLGH